MQTSAAERLMGDGQHPRSIGKWIAEETAEGGPDGPTFQPCIDPRSAKIDASLTARHQTVARANEPQHATREAPPPPPSRHDVLYSHAKRSELRKWQAQLQAAEDSHWAHQRACTFKPQMLAKPHNATSSDVPVEDRLLGWQHERDMKIAVKTVSS